MKDYSIIRGTVIGLLASIVIGLFWIHVDLLRFCRAIERQNEMTINVVDLPLIPLSSTCEIRPAPGTGVLLRQSVSANKKEKEMTNEPLN